MDNHYVPTSPSAPVCEALRKSGIDAPIDVHLMSRRGSTGAGIRQSRRELHQLPPEATQHVDRTIQLIRIQGASRVWCSIPHAVELLDYVIEKIDLILVMSVNPGFADRSSSRSSAQTRRRRARGSRLPSAKFASKSTAGQSRECRRDSQAGADTFVSGSASSQCRLRIDDQIHAGADRDRE